MTKESWSRIPSEQLNPLVKRQALHTENMTVARLVLLQGAVVPTHHHENEQITTIERGRLKFSFPDHEVVVEAGDMLPIPPHVPHSVEALEDSVAVDLFAPRREDWIRGDDAYLRR